MNTLTSSVQTSQQLSIELGLLRCAHTRQLATNLASAIALAHKSMPGLIVKLQEAVRSHYHEVGMVDAVNAELVRLKVPQYQI